MGRILEPRQKGFEVCDTFAFLPDPRGRDTLQLELHLQDVAGEPHAANRGAKEVGVLVV